MLVWLLRIWRELPEPLRGLYLRVRYGHFAVGIAALIRDDQGRVLLVHRTYSYAEPWALPGGWLENHDQDMPHALERELREETGLRVKVGPLLAVERDGFAIVVLLEAQLLDPIDLFRASPEVSEVGWVDLREFGSLSRLNTRLLRRVMS